MNDRWFEQKLIDGLPVLNRSKQLLNSASSTTLADIENVVFQINEQSKHQNYDMSFMSFRD